MQTIKKKRKKVGNINQESSKSKTKPGTEAQGTNTELGNRCENAKYTTTEETNGVI